MLGERVLSLLPSAGLVARVEQRRIETARAQTPAHRSDLGQFFTPARVASFLAGMFTPTKDPVCLLDAGAGVGSLSAAFCEEVFGRTEKPSEFSVTAYEVDQALQRPLQATIDECQTAAKAAGISFQGEALSADFIKSAVAMLRGGLFTVPRRTFTHAILNPPYKKLSRDSEHRRLLQQVGIEASNLYVAFLALAVELLVPGGELVAITPRSFCNGPYFKSFRESFLEKMSFRQIHIFEARNKAFGDDEVLQENIIFRAVKGGPATPIKISSSVGPEDERSTARNVEPTELVRPDDPDRFIRIVPDDFGQQVSTRMQQFTSSLAELGLQVSTGRVVDFRVRDFLRDSPSAVTAPLIYPVHLSGGLVSWPKVQKKPNALVVAPETKSMLFPSGTYILTKRFSSKEEKKRLVASLCTPEQLKSSAFAVENHLNVYHQNGGGLPTLFAKGLWVFLNSTIADEYFRQFSGHTQVNATDLKSLKYPNLAQLESLGAAFDNALPTQAEIDQRVEQELSKMTDTNTADPIQAKRKIEEAIEILKALGFPKEQLNERSGLTLLALLDLRPAMLWVDAQAPLRGITPMMEFFKLYYGKEYAPNSRETVRRFTVHQFLQAGLVLENPDKPDRAVNSPKAVYQISPGALSAPVLRSAAVVGEPQGVPRKYWHFKTAICSRAGDVSRSCHAPWRQRTSTLARRTEHASERDRRAILLALYPRRSGSLSRRHRRKMGRIRERTAGGARCCRR